MNNFPEFNPNDVAVEQFDCLYEASEFAEDQVSIGCAVIINQTPLGYFVSVYEPQD